jgi:hypothetical protein
MDRTYEDVVFGDGHIGGGERVVAAEGMKPVGWLF